MTLSAYEHEPLRLAISSRKFGKHAKLSNLARRDSLRKLAKAYRPDCIIDLIWQGCLTYDIESHWVRRIAEEELNVPFLRLETDYSPSDSARIAMRVEALYETVRSRQ